MLDVVGFCREHPDIHVVVRRNRSGDITVTMANENLCGRTAIYYGDDPRFLHNLKESLDAFFEECDNDG